VATHDQSTRFNILKKKAMNLAQVLALSHCSANAAWLFYFSIFFPSCILLILLSCLLKSQLKELQGPIVSLTLNQMHHSKRTARVLVCGPQQFGGLEFGTLETKWGAGKLILLICHLCTPGQPHEFPPIVLGLPPVHCQGWFQYHGRHNDTHSTSGRYMITNCKGLLGANLWFDENSWFESATIGKTG
jgi:hypothetical protein